MLHLTPFFTIYLLCLAALLGACMGSFLGCVASRLVSGESVLRGRSRCDRCGHALGARDLVPVLSWVLARGRCRYCGERLSPAYPVQELVCALIYVSVLLRFDVSVEALMWLILFSLLFPAALVDLAIQIIPDRFLIAAALAFFPMAWLAGGLPLILRGLIGAAALFLPMLLVVLAFDRLSGRESMGGGDLKLIAVLGLYLGWQQGLMMLILACLLGLLFAAALGRGKSSAPFPFGPSLAAAGWLTALFGQSVIAWYSSLF